MTRKHGTQRTTLQMMRAARDNCAKVTVLSPTPQKSRKTDGTARIIPFTKSRAGG